MAAGPKAPPSGAPDLHGWKTVLDIIGQIAAPNIERAIPGTPGHYAETQATQQASDKNAAEIANYQAETAEHQRQAGLPTPTKEPLHFQPGEEVQNPDGSFTQVGTPKEAAAREPLHVPPGEMVQQPNGLFTQVGTPKAAETRYEPRTIQDPNSQTPKPLDVLFDPIQGQFIDPATKQPLANARAYEKPAEGPQPPHQMVMVPNADGSFQSLDVKPGMTVPKGATTLLEAGKEQTAGDAKAAAQQYADDYLASKNFTGAGDEALMEKYFELAKPSSGFRMTQPQIEMLTQARDMMGGIVARGKHMLSPNAPYFSDTQRQQIVNTMKDISRAGDESRNSASKSGPPAAQPGMKVQSRTVDGKTEYRQVPVASK